MTVTKQVMATETDIHPNDIIHANEVAGRAINLAVRIMHDTKVKPLDMLLMLQRHLTEQFIEHGAECMAPIASDPQEKVSDAYNFCHEVMDAWNSAEFQKHRRETLHQWFFRQLTNVSIRTYVLFHVEGNRHVEVHRRMVRPNEQFFAADQWNAEFDAKALECVKDDELHLFHVRALFANGEIAATKIFTIRNTAG